MLDHAIIHDMLRVSAKGEIMLVICKNHPGEKSYKIEKIRNVYFCYPKTEAEYLELLWIHNGNNIQGNLDLKYTNKTELPDNLTVEGNFNLFGSKIKELPTNLTVGGYLDINYTKIKVLPDNFRVEGYLNLGASDIPKNYVIPIGIKGEVIW